MRAKRLFNALFEGALRSNDSIIEFNGPEDILRLVLRYVYCGFDCELQDALQQIQPQRILLLLLVSNQYVIEGLQMRCEWALSKHVTAENVLDLLDSISSINAPLLRTFCLHFVITNQVAVNETNVTDELLLAEMLILQDLWKEREMEMEDASSSTSTSTTTTATEKERKVDAKYEPVTPSA